MRIRLFIKHVSGKIYRHFYGMAEDDRACLMVTCNECGEPVDILEGYYDHIAYQCLQCGKVTEKVTCRLETVAEAKRKHHPAHVLM